MKTLFRNSLQLAAILATFVATESAARASSYSNAVLADNPISFQEFEDLNTATAADSTANGHNGTYLGGYTQGLPTGFANLGAAVKFDGTTGRVQIPSSAAYQIGTGDFSIEAWFNTSDPNRGDMFTYKGGTTDFGIHSSSNGSPTASAYHDGFIATSSAPINTWHQVVYTRTGGVGQLYLDGSPTASGTDNQQFSNAATDLLIGSNHTGSPSSPAINFNGYMDEVSIYATALSASRVATHYQAGTQVTPSIGVNFVGGGGPGSGASLNPSDSAGVIARTNWNNQTGSSGSGIALNDDSGTASGATMTFSSSGTYTTTGNTPVGGDEKLNQGFIYGNGSVTVANIPYSHYDVIAYTLNDGSGRQQTTTLTSADGTFAYYGESPNPNGFVDGNGGTLYNYARATSTTSGTYTVGANYVWFHNLSASSFVLSTTAPGNGYLNGFQVVAIPEPSSLVLAGLGMLGLVRLARRGRHVKANAVLAAALVLGCSMGSADAATISVNFEGGNNAGAPTAMLPTDTAGVTPYAAANWNNFIGNTGTSGALVDSTGAATGVTITVVGADLYGSGTGTGNANSKMLNGYVDGNNDVHTNTWTFNNVPAGNYTLISYALPDNLDGRQSEYSVNGGTAFDLKSDANASYQNFGFVQANGTGGNYTSGNYVRFLNVSPDGLGQITLTGTGVFRNYSNGIQLVPVPEPSSLVLAGLGLLGMFGIRRRAKSGGSVRGRSTAARLLITALIISAGLTLGSTSAYADFIPNAIQGTTAYAGANSDGAIYEQQVVNGAGLTVGNPLNAATWTHDNNWPNGWQMDFNPSSPPADKAWFTVDLGATHYGGIGAAVIWNTREVTDRGSNLVNVYYAVNPTTGISDGQSVPSFLPSNGWALLTSNHQIPQSPPGGGSGNNSAQDDSISLAGIQARYVAFQILSNWGSTIRTGFSEIQFTLVPEPSSLVMAGMGMVGLFAAARRRRAGK